MSILQSLRVVSTKHPHQASTITQRRNVLLKKIHEQIEAAKARGENDAGEKCYRDTLQLIHTECPDWSEQLTLKAPLFRRCQ